MEDEVKPAHCDHPIIGRLEVQTCTENGQKTETVNFDVRHQVEVKADSEGMDFDIDGNNSFHISRRFYHSYRLYPVARIAEPEATGDEVSGD